MVYLLGYLRYDSDFVPIWGQSRPVTGIPQIFFVLGLVSSSSREFDGNDQIGNAMMNIGRDPGRNYCVRDRRMAFAFSQHLHSGYALQT